MVGSAFEDLPLFAVKDVSDSYQCLRVRGPCHPDLEALLQCHLLKKNQCRFKKQIMKSLLVFPA